MNFFNFVVFLSFFLSLSTIQTLFTRACVCVCWSVVCVCELRMKGGMEKKVCLLFWRHLAKGNWTFVMRAGLVPYLSITLSLSGTGSSHLQLKVNSFFDFALAFLFFLLCTRVWFCFVLFLPSAKQLFRNIRSNRVRSSSTDCWRGYIVWISYEYRMYYIERKLDNILASDWNSFC